MGILDAAPTEGFKSWTDRHRGHRVVRVESRDPPFAVIALRCDTCQEFLVYDEVTNGNP